MANQDRVVGPSPRLPDGASDSAFDLLPSNPNQSARDGLGIEAYQRLIANPFLGVLALGGSWLAFRAAIEARQLDLEVLAASTVFVSRWLLQFHCLDCGSTGWLKRWRDHECHAVRGRLASHRPRRIRGPKPSTQTVLWFVGLLLGALYAVAHRH